MPRSSLLLCFAFCSWCSALIAQPVVQAPGYTVSLFPTGVLPSSPSMAVDADGFVYISQAGSQGGLMDSVTIVSPLGATTPGQAAALGALSNLAVNPQDGQVYILANPLPQGTPSNVYRLSSNGAAVLVDTLTFRAFVFTIDDLGNWIYAAAIPGGLFRQAPGGAATPLGPGFGGNFILQSVAFSDDILIANSNEVRRWTGGVVVPYATFPVFGTTQVRSIARSSFDQLGRGALIGLTNIPPLAVTGTSYLYHGTDSAGSATAFATEPFQLSTLPLASVASSIRGPVYWLTGQYGTGGTAPNLYAITENSNPTAPPFLAVNVNPTPTGSFITADVWGPSGGRVLLGALFGTPTSVGLERYTPFGWILDILNPGYLPLVDGPGAFGPPASIGVIPANGAWNWNVTAPTLGGVNLVAQALIESFPTAPNGWFHISNLAPVTVP